MKSKDVIRGQRGVFKQLLCKKIKKVILNPDDFFDFCTMPPTPKTSFRHFGWTLLLYGAGLGLLLAGLQAARYRLLVLDHSLEIYLGLIAILFTILGIWAGRRLSPKAQTPLAPLSESALDQVLEKLSITRREYEVLQLIAQGLSNQEIAERLFVSLNTVKTHSSNLFSKLDAQRRTQAVQKARTLGLLAPPHPKV